MTERPTNPHKGATGLRRIVRAAGYSIAGLRFAFINEAAFRQEVALFVVLAPLAFWVSDDPVSRILMIGSLMLVMIVELLNSAIEAAIDRISPDIHPLAKAAKDIGSAAVMLSLFLSALIWSIVLLS
jgi:diacylglycerol kinase (ATP)